MTDTHACSRCGTTTGQHSVKCLQAMALAWAMGVEERPRVGPVRVEDDGGALAGTMRLLTEAREELARVEAQNNEQAELIASLRGRALAESGGRGWPAVVQELRETIAERDATIASLRAEVERWKAQFAHLYDEDFVPVTQLPPGYYDRLAEIDREVESPAFQQELADMAASPALEVEVLDEQNAVVTPRDWEADLPPQEPLNLRPEPETPPAPEQPVGAAEAAPAAPAPEATDWPKLVRELRAARGISAGEFGKLIGASHQTIRDWESGKVSVPGEKWQTKLRALVGLPAPEPVTPPTTPAFTRMKPETLAAIAAVEKFVADNVVAVGLDVTRTDDNGRVWNHYTTSAEVLEAYEKAGLPYIPSVQREIGRVLGARFTDKRQGPVHGGRKPMCFFGAALRPAEVETPAEPEPAAPAAPTPADHKSQVEEIRELMAQARAQAARVEKLDDPAVDVPPGPNEMAVKLAQLKHFGIGGVHGVSKTAASAAIDGLHPTGRDVWKWVAPESDAGVSDAELDATTYQLLVKCMNGLPPEYGYDYKEDVLATAGFRQEDVDAALRAPQRVEIRPESWDREKRYPVLGFHKGDVTVILGMRTPTKPRVIAAYWQAQLQSDTYRVDRHGGGGSRKASGLPTTVSTSLSRLDTAGAELVGDPLKDKTVKVLYKGQDLGKITCGARVTKATVQSDYQRTLRKMQAIDRRQEAKASA